MCSRNLAKEITIIDKIRTTMNWLYKCYIAKTFKISKKGGLISKTIFEKGNVANINRKYVDY